MQDLESFYSIYALYLWAGLAAIVLLLGLWLLALQIRLGRMVDNYAQLMSGLDEGNLEDVLARQVSYLKQTGDKVDVLTGEVQRTEQTLQTAVQKVGLVRFNPFGDTGGDQSFAVALLDARGDGIVLSSLFSRTTNRIFAKPIESGASKYTLTDEERQAIKNAIG